MTINTVDDALAAWLAAATDPAHDLGVVASYGLCYWVRWECGFGRDGHEELKERFERDGLDPEYPFGEADYYSLAPKSSCPKRLAWVRKELAATM